MFEQIPQFLLKVVTYGGGSAAIAFLVFQFLGKNWIENKFAQRLEQLKHHQALEIQRLRVEIDSLLSGTIKLQDREFQVLPEAWQKLNEAYELISWLVSPSQEYPDLDRMSEQELEEFLSKTEFSETKKTEIRTSKNKLHCYMDIVFWVRLYKVRTEFAALQKFVARNGIFFPFELKEKFTNISDLLWSALVSKEVGHQAHDYKLQREGWIEIKEKAEPLYKSIEADIQSRLHSHGRKQ